MLLPLLLCYTDPSPLALVPQPPSIVPVFPQAIEHLGVRHRLLTASQVWRSQETRRPRWPWPASSQFGMMSWSPLTEQGGEVLSIGQVVLRHHVDAAGVCVYSVEGGIL